MREPQARRDQREIIVPTRAQDPRPKPRRRSAPGPTDRFAAVGVAARAIGRTVLRHPGEVLGVGIVLGAVSMICLNALGDQVGRHPAPIFPKVAARSVPVADRPKPVQTPAESARAAASRVEASKVEAGKVEASKPETSKPEGAKAEGPARTPGDNIGEIIRASDPKSAETTASVATQGGLSLTQAQRALVKLGYGPLKADGIMGAGTRAAIEKFERDRKLPVKGEPSSRTLRELAARAAAARG